MFEQSVVLPLHATVPLTVLGEPMGGLTPGWQQTAFIIGLPFGQAVPLVQEKLVVKGVGVTTATLAPCLTAFLREFFVYHALENSAMPIRMINSNKSTNAVSTNV